MNNADMPAFPDTNSLNYEGLTKREYFAGLAMQGLLAGGHDKAYFAARTEEQMSNLDWNTEEAVSLAAISFANGLLSYLEES